MYRILIILAFLISPSLAMSQNKTIKTKKELTIKKIDPISKNPKIQSGDFIIKKSKAIISVEAYIKSLKLRRKKIALT